MQVLDQKPTPEIKGTPIGGWLWVVMVIIMASGLQILLSIFTTVTELLADDWNQYVHSTDELLRTRINIYAYLILSMVIGLAFIVWSLVNFFLRKRRFPAIFMGLLGYFILTEVLRIYLLNYSADLSHQDVGTIESGLVKTGFVAIIAGLYLSKGKRPNQTFVN